MTVYKQDTSPGWHSNTVNESPISTSCHHLSKRTHSLDQSGPQIYSTPPSIALGEQRDEQMQMSEQRFLVFSAALDLIKKATLKKAKGREQRTESAWSLLLHFPAKNYFVSRKEKGHVRTPCFPDPPVLSTTPPIATLYCQGPSSSDSDLWKGTSSTPVPLSSHAPGPGTHQCPSAVWQPGIAYKEWVSHPGPRFPGSTSETAVTAVLATSH